MFGSKCVQTNVHHSGCPLNRSISHSTSVRCMDGLWSWFMVSKNDTQEEGSSFVQISFFSVFVSLFFES